MSDLSHADFKKHPVTRTLKSAAFGDLPTEKELDRLELPPDVRRKVFDAALVTVGIKAGGENQAARIHAHDQAARIVDSLPDQLKRPDYLREEDDTPDDPRALADRVSRGW